jgi:hypothetical protein
MPAFFRPHHSFDYHRELQSPGLLLYEIQVQLRESPDTRSSFEMIRERVGRAQFEKSGSRGDVVASFEGWSVLIGQTEVDEKMHVKSQNRCVFCIMFLRHGSNRGCHRQCSHHQARHQSPASRPASSPQSIRSNPRYAERPC